MRGDWETRSEWNRGIHPEVKREDYPAMIEGILFRYLIHARDVLHMEKAVVGERSAVILSVSIGKEVLRITLAQSTDLAGTALVK